MRSERRHELEHNELADWMANAVSAVKPYANAIMGVVLALLIVGVAAVLWAQKVRSETAQSWQDFHGAMAKATSGGNFAELEDVVSQYPGTDAAYWAAVVAGDLHLATGCDELFSNKASANQELTKAVASYEDVLQSTNSALRERATFGLARARESRGELQKAEKHYQELVEGWPDSPYAKTAQSRLDDLKQPAVKEFYDRFAKFDPKPALSNEPGTPGERLPFDTTSPPSPGEPLFPSLDPLKLEQQAPAKAKDAENAKPEDAKPAAPATTEETKPAAPATPEAATPAATAPDAAKPDAAPKADTPPKADAAPKTDETPKADAPKDEKK
jgi:tetratricopeptide (TPR) repeat protein